ncbi:MAG: exonuclease SbcCD subunit D [Oscillospiraceae bacterium]
MKILHLSDLHLGKSPFKKDISAVQRRLSRIIADTVKEHDIGAVLVSGDVYDTATSTAAANVLWDELARMLIVDCKVPVCVISGNHDGAERLSVCSEILKACGLHIRGRLDGFDVPVSVGNADIYMIPFFEKGHAEGFFKKQFTSLSAAYEEITDVIRRRMDSSRCNIIMAHCFASGGVPSQSETSAELIFSEKDIAAVGTLSVVPTDVFRGFDYAALGHIHKPQTLGGSSGDTIIRYCGTAMKYSFSEEGQEKSFSIYDTDTHTLETVSCPELLKFRVVRGSFDEVCAKAPDFDGTELVRVELTDFDSTVTADRIRELYPNAMQVVRPSRSLPEMRKSDISDDDIAQMNVLELAAKYLKEFYGAELTDSQTEWLRAAEKECESDDTP